MFHILNCSVLLKGSTRGLLLLFYSPSHSVSELERPRVYHVEVMCFQKRDKLCFCYSVYLPFLSTSKSFTDQFSLVPNCSAPHLWLNQGSQRYAVHSPRISGCKQNRNGRKRSFQEVIQYTSFSQRICSSERITWTNHPQKNHHNSLPNLTNSIELFDTLRKINQTWVKSIFNEKVSVQLESNRQYIYVLMVCGHQDISSQVSNQRPHIWSAKSISLLLFDYNLQTFFTWGEIWKQL